MLLCACAAAACRVDRAPAPATVAAYTSPMWYEETSRCFDVSADGRQAIFRSRQRSRVYDLATGRELADATRWTPAASRRADFTPGQPTVSIGDPASPTVVRLDGAVNGVSWTPDERALYAIVLHPDGLSSLAKITPDGAVTIVRAELDASPYLNTLTFSPDGSGLFLALAGDTAPNPAARHDPEAPHRDLDIYELDLRSGRLHVVAAAPGDDFCPVVAGDSLYWTHNEPTPEVVVFPLAGGDPRVVAEHGFLPRWSPDGRQIAFTRAYYRLSDYGLDMDGWVVGVDSAGAISYPAKPWITGFGEDMGPVWSPDGRWVAYHSHRSATPVPLYESPGRTDDTWLRAAAGGPEIRLTDFGFEVGPPDWAPDGRHLIFDSWDRDGVPRFAKPWIVTIDPASGRSTGAERMPLPPGVAGIGGEAWSPRGADIAFIERVDDERRALWLSHADGSAARKVTDFRSATLGGVAWTPDGGQLVYGALAGDRMQIFAVDSGGGAARQLTHGDVNLLHPSVSPDGRLVAASRIPWRKALRRIALPRSGA
jgi:Tol biopolymer transport system component